MCQIYLDRFFYKISTVRNNITIRSDLCGDKNLRTAFFPVTDELCAIYRTRHGTVLLSLDVVRSIEIE